MEAVWEKAARAPTLVLPFLTITRGFFFVNFFTVFINLLSPLDTPSKYKETTFVISSSSK